jgi:hypothetical protein
MIAPYAFHKYLREHLLERSFPIEVEYERRFKDAPRKTLIVIGRDRNGLEPFSPQVNKGKTEPRRAVRMLPCLGLVYAQSSLKGATHGDHETSCYELVDALVCALEDFSKTNHVELSLTGGRLLRADELDWAVQTNNPGTQWTGVVHLTQFQLGHGVFDRDASGKPFGRRATIRHTELTALKTTAHSAQETLE